MNPRVVRFRVPQAKFQTKTREDNLPLPDKTVAWNKELKIKKTPTEIPRYLSRNLSLLHNLHLNLAIGFRRHRPLMMTMTPPTIEIC
jgi:hypothetical protein